MQPQRIQLRRTKGWRLPRNTVVVARPSKWGNPLRVSGDLTPEQAVARFAEQTAPALDLSELRGKNLACWCPLDRPCHADVLLRLANR